MQEAIRIGLDNSEVVRVIPFGAQGIPIGGFEPTPLEHRGRRAASPGAAGLRARCQSVYDPAIQETQIAQALSIFDTAFTTSMIWGKNTQPFNNAIQGGSFGFSGAEDAGHLDPGHGQLPDRACRSGRRPVPSSASSTTSTGSTRTARS